jgi:hypothetical protein
VFVVSYCYLLHFAAPICETRPAQHYLGFAQDVVKRECDHKRGIRCYGAALTFAAYERNINFSVVRVWANATKRDEKLLRDLKANPRLCPICNPALQLVTRINSRGNYQTYRLGDPKRPRYGDLNLVRDRVPRKARERVRNDGTLNYKPDVSSGAPIMMQGERVLYGFDFDSPF